LFLTSTIFDVKGNQLPIEFFNRVCLRLEFLLRHLFFTSVATQEMV
jgi:hypothetical protein